MTSTTANAVPTPNSPLAIARPDLLQLAPYEHAAWLPELTRLHANELPWRSPGDDSEAGLNRYPEPQPQALVQALAGLYGVPPEQVLVTRGGDEGIDLLTRAFCRAGQDSILTSPPTFGMYPVAARVQGAGVIRVPLLAEQGFALDEDALVAACVAGVKLVYVCSPNNPTGNLIDEALILRLAQRLSGRALVVVDEAYIEFADRPSVARHIPAQPWLVVLRTLSKAHALAGARCGTVLADPAIIGLLRRIVEPYNMTQPSIEAVLRALQPATLATARERVRQILAERTRLIEALRACPAVTRVWPSDANFVLAEFRDPQTAFDRACSAGLLVRKQRELPRCLRITVGTPDQNRTLVQAFNPLPNQVSA